MADTHRGAFGEHGGESGAFIERTFRERIIAVGVTLVRDEGGSEHVAAVLQRPRGHAQSIETLRTAHHAVRQQVAHTV